MIRKEVDEAIVYLQREVNQIKKGKLDTQLVDFLDCPMSKVKFPAIFKYCADVLPEAPTTELTREDLLELISTIRLLDKARAQAARLSKEKDTKLAPLLSSSESTEENLLKQWNTFHLRANELEIKQATSLTRRSPKDAVDLIRIKKKIQDRELTTWKGFKTDVVHACTLASKNTNADDTSAIKSFLKMVEELIPNVAISEAEDDQEGMESETAGSVDENPKRRSRRSVSSVKKKQQPRGTPPSRRASKRTRKSAGD